MNNLFNTVNVKTPPSSVFDMSFSNRLSFPIGKLIPVLAEECIPGDNWRLRSQSLVRFAPLVSPVMEKFDVYIDYFFVPYRQLWTYFEDWITGNDIENMSMPTVYNTDGTTTPYAIGTLADYFGIPNNYENDSLNGLNILLFYAYQKCWFDYYRDENLEFNDPELSNWDSQWKINLVESKFKYNPNQFPFKLQNANWEHDYFTSGLPFAQKGDAITIPFQFTADAPVYRDNFNQGDRLRLTDGSDFQATTQSGRIDAIPGTEELATHTAFNTSSINPQIASEIKQQYADLSNTLSAPTIAEFRRAEAVQKWLELNARVGTRYVEFVLGHFGTRTADYRLDRAEFLGREKFPVIVSEVLQTSESTETSPLANMAGRAITTTEGQSLSYYCREHGAILGIAFIRTKAAYYQGIDKKFLRKDKFDYATPLLAQIGEQPILNMEVMTQNNPTLDNNTFAYQSRYADWKYSKSLICGEFKNTLDEWHYARKFATMPALNKDFITWSNDNRIFAVNDQQNVYMWINFMNTVKRNLPYYGTPTID